MSSFVRAVASTRGNVSTRYCPFVVATPGCPVDLGSVFVILSELYRRDVGGGASRLCVVSYQVDARDVMFGNAYGDFVVVPWRAAVKVMFGTIFHYTLVAGVAWLGG